MADLYGFKQGPARTLLDIANGTQTRGNRSDPSSGDSGPTIIKLASADGEIAATTDGNLTSGTAQIVFFDPTSSPAAMSATNKNTVTVWNPHEGAIPDGTYLIIAKTGNGWIIIAPLNYCP